jgi:hypothetical protein
MSKLLLSLVSAGLGIVDFAALYAAVQTSAFAAVEYDAAHPVSSVYRVRLLEQVGIIGLGLLCLVGVFTVIHYYDDARTRPVLLRRFRRATVVQLAIAATALLVPLVLVLIKR